MTPDNFIFLLLILLVVYAIISVYNTKFERDIFVESILFTLITTFQGLLFIKQKRSIVITEKKVLFHNSLK